MSAAPSSFLRDPRDAHRTESAGDEPMTRSTHPSFARRAFTLIEVLIVLAIVAMIGGFVTVSLLTKRDQADLKAAEINLNTLSASLDAFRFDFRRYPTDDEGLAVLWDKEKLDSESDGSLWSGYLTKPLPEDVWGNEWGYAQEADDFDSGEDESTTAVAPYDLWSFGPDGEDGTDDDIRTGGTGSGDDEGGLGSDLVPDDGP